MMQFRGRRSLVVVLALLALLLPVPLSRMPGRAEAQTAQSPCEGLLEALKFRAGALGASAGAVGSVSSLTQARGLLVGIAADTTGEYGATAKAAAANAIVQIDTCLNTQNAPTVDPNTPSAPPAQPAQPPSTGSAPLPAPVPAPVPGDLRDAPRESPPPAPGQPGANQPTPILPFAEQGGTPRGGGAGVAASPASPGGAPPVQDPGALDFARPVTFLRPTEAALTVPTQSRAAIGPARPTDTTGPAPAVQRFDRTSGNLVPFTDGQVRDGDTLQLGANTTLPFTLRGPDGTLATGTVVARGTAQVTFGPQGPQTAWDRIMQALARAHGERLPQGEPLPPAAMIGITGSASLRWWVQTGDVPPPPIIVTASPNRAGEPSSVVVELYRTVVGAFSEIGPHVSIIEGTNRLLDNAAAYIRAADREVAIYLTGKMEVQKPRPDQTQSFTDLRLQQSLGVPTTIYTPGQSVRDKETAFSVESSDANGKDRTTIVVTEGSVIVRDLGSGRERTITAGNTDVFETSASTATGAEASVIPATMIAAAVAAALVAIAVGVAIAARSRSKRA